jgi:hypothetical protein
MNYEQHGTVTGAAELSALAVKVSDCIGSYLNLGDLALVHGCIDVQALNQQAVRNVVRRQGKRYRLSLG